MADEKPTGLTHLQKDILIFLLVALIVIGLTLFLSWIVWKKWCWAELKKARRERELGVQEDWPRRSDGFNETSHIRRTSASSYSRTRARTTSDPNFWRSADLQSVHPSAPSLETFRGPSAAPSTSIETVSSGYRRQSDSSIATSSRLPSYETIMRDRQHQ